MPRPLYPRGNRPLCPLNKRLGGPWAVEKRKILPCRDSNPADPARSSSLYRLSYPEGFIGLFSDRNFFKCITKYPCSIQDSDHVTDVTAWKLERFFIYHTLYHTEDLLTLRETVNTALCPCTRPATHRQHKQHAEIKRYAGMSCRLHYASTALLSRSHQYSLAAPQPVCGLAISSFRNYKRFTGFRADSDSLRSNFLVSTCTQILTLHRAA
jgi:hypothetical protein